VRIIFQINLVLEDSRLGRSSADNLAEENSTLDQGLEAIVDTGDVSHTLNNGEGNALSGTGRALQDGVSGESFGLLDVEDTGRIQLGGR
jgi:hypothetical protein